MEKQKKSKTYFLSTEEKSNLQGRKAILNQWNYVLKIVSAGIQEDMTGYIKEVVKKRLSIHPEWQVKVDIDKGTLEVDEINSSNKKNE